MEGTNRRDDKVVKGYVTSKFVILTVAAAGTGLYLVGRSRGFRSGTIEGHGIGYKEGVNDVGAIVREVKKEMTNERDLGTL